MRKEAILVLSVLFVAITLSIPSVSADSNVSISLHQPPYCTLYPLAGTTSCAVGNPGQGLNAATCLQDYGSPMTFSWSYDSTHFSVVVTGIDCGSPCHPYTMTNPQQLTFSDNPFDFQVTYTASTCQSGQYPLTFTAVSNNHLYSDQQTFTIIVRCVFAPLQ